VLSAVAAFLMIRVTTEKGQIAIDTVDPDVEVTVLENGAEVLRLDQRTGWEKDLPAGEYEVELKGRKEGLMVAPRHLTVRRGKRETVWVTQDLAGAAERGEWVPLFNGKDLTGWKPPEGKSRWTVKGGLLVGEAGILYSARDTYQNFQLRLTARVSHGGIGGQGFRATGQPIGPWPAGYYVQTNGNGPGGDRTGSLFRVRGQGSERLVAVPQAPPAPNDWFEEEVSAVDNVLEVKVNGSQVASFSDGTRAFTRGRLALHVGGGTMEYRSIQVKDLPAPARPRR
jgi:hypothetical protein